MTTCWADNTEQRLMTIRVLGQKYYLVFFKGQFLVQFFFNIFLIDLIFVAKDIDIASYADDSTSCLVENNIGIGIASLEHATDALYDWFKNLLV